MAGVALALSLASPLPKAWKAGEFDPSGPPYFPLLNSASPPDHPSGVMPGRPAVQGAVEDTEGSGQSAGVPADVGRLLLPQEGVGHEAGNLEQAVAVGVPEGRACDDSVYGEVAGVPAVIAGPVARGHRVVVPEPVVEAGGHFLGFLAEDYEGVTARPGGGGVDPVEQPIQADPPVRRNVVLVQADVGCTQAAGLDGKVLDEAQPLGKHLGTIVHGAPATTNVDFGGDDWKTLFITTRTSVSSIQLKKAGIPVPVGG